MKSQFALALILVFISSPLAFAATFSIENIHVHDLIQNIDAGIKVNGAFVPQVEVEVSVSQDAASQNLLAKAYFYDGSGRLIQTFDSPSIAERPVPDGVGGASHASVWPTILPKDKPTSIYFPLPDNLPANWTIVTVFGNTNGAVAASQPADQEQNFNYPERRLVAKTLLSPDVAITDAAQATPLIEQVVQSDNPKYPAFTLLMHLPHGVTNPKDVSGVLATCMIADSVEQIRDSLNAIKPEGDPNPYFAYAEAHKLAVIAWGAKWVWDSYANFDELDKDQNRNWDDDFKKLADAWDRGIDLWVNQYGIPDHDYLLYGFCAGGEWAHRLAMHKPNRFLAVQVHISASYEVPTPEGSHLLWLITTGELDGGCDRTRRFYSAARDLGYPIIFKAVIGLGHADSPIADQLGLRFFDYALAMKSKRDAATAENLGQSQPLDLSGFDASPFYGDLMNQDIFPAHDKEMIPSGFLVPLPTKDIADVWNQ